jgi:GT2 family glycosyltransferase
LKVSIVIPNWNGAQKLKKNLPFVLKVKGIDEIIVADDGSTDDSIRLLEEEFPEVKLVKRNSQGGFSTNVNSGFKKASGELIFLLNSDAVPEKDTIGKVLRHFENKEVFSVGFNTGGNWSWGQFKDGFFEHYMTNQKVTTVHETLWASGGSGLFRKSIWDELGGLDTLMDPFYWEDVDIGYRAWKRGYINLWDPDAKVEHYKQTGVIEENYKKSYIEKISQRNQLIFIWKNITDSDLIWQHIWSLLRRLIIHPKYLFILLDTLIKVPQILNERASQQKGMKLSDKQILNKYTQA